MTSLTLRRKLQKKLKHRPYGKCPICKERINRMLDEEDHKIVGYGWSILERCRGCKYEKRIGWTGIPG